MKVSGTKNNIQILTPIIGRSFDKLKPFFSGFFIMGKFHHFSDELAGLHQPATPYMFKSVILGHLKIRHKN